MACRCACMGVAINKSRTLKKLSASPVWWFMGNKDIDRLFCVYWQSIEPEP